MYNNSFPFNLVVRLPLIEILIVLKFDNFGIVFVFSIFLYLNIARERYKVHVKWINYYLKLYFVKMFHSRGNFCRLFLKKLRYTAIEIFVIKFTACIYR